MRHRFFSRRQSMQAALGAGALSLMQRISIGAPAQKTIGLGFSLYGMKSLSLEESLKACAEIGYDCVELPVMPDWPADSARLSQPARRELRARLADRKLRLTALMENLPSLGDDKAHQANLERLKRAVELARQLTPEGPAESSRPPLIETILGGKPGDWDAVKTQLVERLSDWATVLNQGKIVLAVKAHVGNAMQRPEQLLWLVKQVASPSIKPAYDYSHFELQSLALADTMRELVPHSVFIHVKDTQHAQGKRGFLLPGEGSIDYGEYFRLLKKHAYGGDVVVEVSSQVFYGRDYDPLAAARKCYNHLAPAMMKAGVSRG